MPLFFVLMACTGPDGDSADTDTAVDTDTDTVLDGAELFDRKCSTCHGDAGAGTGAGPDIRGEVGASDAVLLDVILNGKGEMAAVAVTEADAQLIVDWIQAW